VVRYKPFIFLQLISEAKRKDTIGEYSLSNHFYS